MRILFTGFTSRTVGSDRNVYDYMSNVFVLQRVLELAGHTVDARQVSLETDPCIEEDYDCAVVGIAACQGLSSRFKLGACWALHKFGKRAAIFPSDGKNIYTFPSSVLTCLTGSHFNKVTNSAMDPLEYFLGDLQQEKNNVVDTEVGHHPEFLAVWRDVLDRLPHSDRNPRCDWPVLVPTFAWGNPRIYGRHFGTDRVTCWDPTNVAIPMQFSPDELAPDGRLPSAHTALDHERQRAWVLSSLQDQSAWLRKQRTKWPVIIVGNKRKARQGEGVDYVPERQMIDEYYTKNWGHLAFGYPLAEGGWWRMRFIHAGMAGIVTMTDDADAMRMPPDFRHSRGLLENWTDNRLQTVAANQWQQLQNHAWSVDRAVRCVYDFVEELVK